MNHGGGGHHIRLFMPRGLMFMFMRRGRKPVSPQYKGRQARVEAALQSLTVKTEQQKYWEAVNERKAIGTEHDLARRSSSMDGVGHSVLAQPETNGIDSAGAGRSTHGSSGATVVNENLGWEALERQLLDMVQANPDLKEVEVKHERTD